MKKTSTVTEQTREALNHELAQLQISKTQVFEEAKEVTFNEQKMLHGLSDFRNFKELEEIEILNQEHYDFVADELHHDVKLINVAEQRDFYKKQIGAISTNMPFGFVEEDPELYRQELAKLFSNEWPVGFYLDVNRRIRHRLSGLMTGLQVFMAMNSIRSHHTMGEYEAYLPDKEQDLYFTNFITKMLRVGHSIRSAKKKILFAIDLGGDFKRLAKEIEMDDRKLIMKAIPFTNMTTDERIMDPF